MKKTVLNILAISAFLAAAGCADNNKSGSKILDNELGAINPQSVEAVSLLEGPWCMGQQNSRGAQYELRSFFKDNGTVSSKQFELQRGVRVKQVGNIVASDWRLEGAQLTTITSGASIDSTVSFRADRGVRYMRITDLDGSSFDYYGCP